MIGKINIGKLHIRGVLRHRFEKQTESWEKRTMWKRWEVGMWFRKYKAVGQKNFNKPSSWDNNLTSIYTVGFELFVIKVWIDIDYGVKHFEI